MVKKTGDEETDKILGDMEEAGEGAPDFVKKEESDESESEEEKNEEDSEEDDEEESDDDESEEEGEGEKEKKEKKPAAKAEGESEEEDEDEDDSDDEEEDEAEDEKKEKDADDEDEEDESEEGDEDEDDESEAHVPLWKRYKQSKKDLKDLRKVVDDLTKAKTDGDFQTKYADFAKKHKLNPDVAKGLVELTAELVAQKVGIDPETKSQIAELTKRSGETKFWDRQDRLYKDDFRKNVAPLAARDKRNVTDLEKELHILAFKPENAKKSLVELYLKLPRKGKKVTSESARAGARTMKAADLDDLGEVNELPDSEFEKASDELARRSKSSVRHARS